MAFGLRSKWRFMRALLSCTLLLLTTFVAQTSRADEDPRDVAGAHYSRGLELANQGLYEAALEQFNDAYTSSPHFAVLYNIGQSQIALGRPLEAIEALSKYLRDGADRVPLSRREQVQAQIALLESKLAELSITTERPGVSIRIDGREVGRTPLFQPIRLAAGTHRITGALADGAHVTRDVTLGEADRQRLELVFLNASETTSPPLNLTPTPVAPTSQASRQLSQPATTLDNAGAPRGNTMRRAAYVIAGAGALSAGAALGVYLWNRNDYEDWRASDSALKNKTPGSPAYRASATANNARASSLTGANHAILGLSIAGGALAAAGATLFFIDRAQARRSSELSLGWGPGSSANVTLAFPW